MALSTSNYFDRVRGVDFANLPEPLRKGHDLVKKVSPNDWAYYHQSEPLRRVANTYFEKMDAYLAQQAPKAKSSSKATPGPKKKVAKGFDWNTENLRKAKELLAKARYAKGDEVQIAEDLHNMPLHEKQYAGRTGIVHSVDVSHDGKKPVLTYLLSIGGEGGSYPEQRLRKPTTKQAPQPKAAKANKPATPAPKKAAGSAPQKKAAAKPKVAPEGPKRTKVKKHGDQNLRQPVSHFDGDLTLIRSFLSLTKGEVTRKRVKGLHARIEKAIVTRKVRKTSPYAALLGDIAELVKKVYAKMTSANVESVGKLNFSDKAIINRAREAADRVELRPSVGLLSRFISLQGTRPQAKTVQALLKSLEKVRREQPGDEYHAATGAAVAVLKDWQEGQPVRITTQQLSGLNGLLGLGCPDTPAGQDCGCTAKKAGR